MATTFSDFFVFCVSAQYMREKVLIRLHFLLILYHAAVPASSLESKPLENFELISMSISLEVAFTNTKSPLRP